MRAGWLREAASWFWLVFFSVFWLAPTAWWGLLNSEPPIAATQLSSRMTNAFSLFTVSQSYVPLQYIQVLLPASTDWRTEEDAHYLRMSPFGARTRFDEMLRKGLDNEEALIELAAYVRRHHAARTGVDPLAVRFVTGVILPPEHPEGAFRKPPLEEIDHTRREVWFVRAYRPVAREVLWRRP